MGEERAGEGDEGQQLSPFTELFLSLAWSSMITYFLRSGTLSTLARLSSVIAPIRMILLPRTPDCQLNALSRFTTKKGSGITISQQRAWLADGTERKRRPTRDGSTWRTDGSAVIFPTSAPSIVALSAPTRCALASLPAALNCSPPPIGVLAGRRVSPVPTIAHSTHAPILLFGVPESLSSSRVTLLVFCGDVSRG